MIERVQVSVGAMEKSAALFLFLGAALPYRVATSSLDPWIVDRVDWGRPGEIALRRSQS